MKEYIKVRYTPICPNVESNCSLDRTLLLDYSWPKGKSFVALYEDFSFKQLMENAVTAKGKSFRCFVSKGFSFNK